MRICFNNSLALIMLPALLAFPLAARATSCTSQAALSGFDRAALTDAASRLAEAVVQQDYPTLKAALLPAVASDWEGIRSAVEISASLLKGGQIQLRNLYLLDATSLTAPADTQFFCSNATATLTVTITMHSLPSGKYAVVLADSIGSPLGGQLAFILAYDAGSGSPWKLGGLSIRPGILEGHDGIWYWTRARELARPDSPKFDPWSAWFSYEAARSLLLPVDFVSSPNLEKLSTEEGQIKNSPAEAFPYDLHDGPRTWKIEAVRLDPSLLHADLGISYQSTGVTDPAAQRTEAIAVMSALLKAQPGLRESFHGLWAYALKDGKPTAVLELPMAQIP